MNFVYAKICDRLDWEDLVLYDSEEDAIKASIESPNIRIEKFIRSNNKFVPTYNYYKNGIFILTDNNPILERSEEQSDPPSLQTNSGETIQQFTEQTDIVSSVFDKIPPRIKRQTNDVPIKLGKLYYEIDKEYLLAGPGNIPDHITIYALIDSLKNEKIDELGISEKHPGYLFQIKRYGDDRFPMAPIFSLKIVRNYYFSYQQST